MNGMVRPGPANARPPAKDIADVVAESAEDMIEIPEIALINCPLVQFRLRKVCDHCPQCEHFRGLADRFPGSNHRFAMRYAVLCQGKVEPRTMQELEAPAPAAAVKGG